MEQFKTWYADSGITDILITFGFNLLIALVILFLGMRLGRFTQHWAEKVMRKKEMDDILVDFIGTIIWWLILAITFVAALQKLGIPATSLVAVLGAAGLAIGLALKDSLSNFAAGVMLVMFRPFAKGDFVEAAGESGSVEEIHLVNTLIVTPDNREITLPNGAIWNSPIINYTTRDTRRIDMEFGVGYGDDLKVAAEILMRVCTEHPKVLKDPAPVVLITALADSSVNFWVRPWTATSDYWVVRAEIMEKAKAELEAAGCNIPFPQRDVHIHEVKEGE
ncbi:mechanosensitive ion channel [Marinihelvus fidelis]|uniref:Small-conductance mechanosensitive channel n=1 Tax=Marinihelvus fidelis TaxID=2613842 RepID=A0A5N0TFR0_9GAMM|nr:mechanosensitive ion channel domain-containing protein [Marinihelvus fidelis]KAA9133983.1 mechanosensitive ion channel [Marinihelvus fidelis]